MPAVLKYKIALCNVFWTEDGVDTRFFETTSDQNNYFDTLTSGLFSPLVNFKMGNNIETSIIYTDTSGRDGSTLCKCNYAVVHKIENEQITERRYFFAYPEQTSGGQMLVRLSLDDIQTNYFSHKSDIAPCFIKRTHLDRVQAYGQDSVKYLSRFDSKLFEREAIQNVSKMLVSRTKLNWKVSNNDEFNTWFYNNVLGWVYVYCDHRAYNLYDNLDSQQKQFTLTTPDMSGSTLFISRRSDLENVLNVFAYPVFRSNKTMRFWNGENGTATHYSFCSKSAYTSFKSNNSGTSYIKALKFSITPPFYVPDLVSGREFTIDGDGNLNIYTTSSTNYRGFNGCELYPTFIYGSGENDGNGLIHVAKNFTFESEPFEVPSVYKNIISKSEFKTWDGNIYTSSSWQTEPKLLSQDYFEFNVTNERGQSFTYDLQKTNANSFTFLMTEALAPDITRSYVRWANPNNESVYIYDTTENLTGLVASGDMSLMVDNDQLSQMLANNKNFYLQNALNIGERAIGGGFMESFRSIGMGVLNTELSVDNMRSAPHSLISANGNAYFNTQYTQPGIYIELYTILPNEKYIVMNEFTMKGYTFNRIGVLSDFDNTRRKFNYIEAEVGAIKGNLSNTEKTRLRERLRAVRFWHNDNPSEFMRNYERWLDG